MKIKLRNSTKAETREARIARIRGRLKQRRAESLRKTREDEEAVNLDAESSQVLYSDKEKDIQVIVGEDTVDGGIVVAVATASEDNLEDETVLASVTVESETDGGDAAESKKRKSRIAAARAAIRERIAARKK